MWHIAIDEPKPFELHGPRTLDEAIALATAHAGDAAFLAGGCDLVDQLKHQWNLARHVINLKTVPGLSGIAPRGGALKIGALTTLWDIERDGAIKSMLPALAHAAFRVATPQIRAIGTLGGNLLQDSRCPYYRGPWHCYRAGGIACDAHHGLNSEHALFGGHRCVTVTPSDTAPALVALDAVVNVRRPEGEMEMPLADVFVDPREDIRHMHRLGPDEILTEILVPIRQGQRSGFVKYAPRGSWDFAQASVAAAFVPRDGRFRDVRIVLGAVAPTPWRSRAAEQAIEGQPMTPEVIAQAVRAAVDAAEPLEHNAYKIALVRKGVETVLTELSR